MLLRAQLNAYINVSSEDSNTFDLFVTFDVAVPENSTIDD